MLRKSRMVGERFSALVEVIRRLLGPDGCPWDRAQTLQSMRRYVIEEAFEVVEAIDAGEPQLLEEELGDLVMQVVFLGELARARGWFETGDVVEGIRAKLVRRHPHVFGEVTAQGPAEALASWEAIKSREKGARGLLEGVPVSMPALLRAVAVGEKAARIGLDWPDVEGVRRKLDEELTELDDAGSPAEELEELGDVLFTLASWARKRGHDPEAALRGALDRFGRRVRRVEADAHADGVALETLDPAAIDERWRQAKESERSDPLP